MMRVTLLILSVCAALVYGANQKLCLYSPATGTVLTPLQLYNTDCPTNTAECMKTVYKYDKTKFQYTGPAALKPKAGEILMFLSQDQQGRLDFTTFLNANKLTSIVTTVSITGALSTNIVQQDDPVPEDKGVWFPENNTGRWEFTTQPTYTDGVILGPIQFVDSYCLKTSYVPNTIGSITTISILSGTVAAPQRVVTFPFTSGATFEFCQYPKTVTSVTNNQCPGATSGSASVSITYGPPTGNSFTWTDQDGNVISTTNTASNLASGVYTSHLVAQQGCTADLQATITDPGYPSFASESHTDATVSAGGSASVVVTGGSAPYNYTWTLEDGAVVSRTDSADNLPAGSVTVTVTDSCNSQISDIIIIGTPPTAPPTVPPTDAPTVAPTEAPTVAPTLAPTLAPTPVPATATPQPPTIAPTPVPATATPQPPTIAPTPVPATATPQPPTIAPTPVPATATPQPPTIAPTPVPATATPQPPTLAPTPVPATATPKPATVKPPTSTPRPPICWPGMYAKDGRCAVCPPGSYNRIWGASSCIVCPRNTFSRGGFDDCSPCYSNQFSSSGAGFCDTCPEGTSRNTTGNGCTPCGAGYIVSHGCGTAPSCQACPAGHYHDNRVSNRCHPCPAGTYSRSGSTSCFDCPENTYSFAGSNSCVACPTRTTCGRRSSHPAACHNDD